MNHLPKTFLFEAISHLQPIQNKARVDLINTRCSPQIYASVYERFEYRFPALNGMSAQQGMIATRLTRLLNLVTLYKVLGGGGEFTALPPDA